MSRTKTLATPVLAVALLSGASLSAPAQNSFFGNKPVSTSAGTVNVRELALPGAAHAYEDGMLGARLDTMTRRRVGATTSHLYLHPPVKGREAKGTYRAEFTAGYEAALRRSARYD